MLLSALRVYDSHFDLLQIATHSYCLYQLIICYLWLLAQLYGKLQVSREMESTTRFKAVQLATACVCEGTCLCKAVHTQCIKHE